MNWDICGQPSIPTSKCFFLLCPMINTKSPAGDVSLVVFFWLFRRISQPESAWEGSKQPCVRQKKKWSDAENENGVLLGAWHLICAQNGPEVFQLLVIHFRDVIQWLLYHIYHLETIWFSGFWDILAAQTSSNKTAPSRQLPIWIIMFDMVLSPATDQTIWTNMNHIEWLAIE